MGRVRGKKGGVLRVEEDCDRDGKGVEDGVERWGRRSRGCRSASAEREWVVGLVFEGGYGEGEVIHMLMMVFSSRDIWRWKVRRWKCDDEDVLCVVN